MAASAEGKPCQYRPERGLYTTDMSGGPQPTTLALYPDSWLNNVSAVIPVKFITCRLINSLH